jgi:pyridoxine/pyridoxamine 5'-phosphate oxidase
VSNTRKVAEIEANPQVKVAWSNLEEQSQVRISGKTVVVKLNKESPLASYGLRGVDRDPPVPDDP